MPKQLSKREASYELAAHFRQHGYVRFQNPERLENEGSQVYKKGNEVRLTARSQAELEYIQKLLRILGYTVARPFQKGAQFRQPIYGRAQIEAFLALVGSPKAST